MIIWLRGVDGSRWDLSGPDAGMQGVELRPGPKRIIEAFVFVGGEPLTAERACSAIRGLTATQFVDAIAERVQTLGGISIATVAGVPLGVFLSSGVLVSRPITMILL